MKEHYYDKLLNIKTGGEQKGFNKSFHYHRYEPSPYSALEIFFDNYELKSSDRVVDFGCGKGRLIFYINHLFNATVVGIEMNEFLYNAAIENQNRFLSRNKKSNNNKIYFYCCLAEKYPIHPRDNRFYFFNPFSIQIFMKIVSSIALSVEEFRRDVELVLYYASEDYTYFLENKTSFELREEIMLSGLCENNPYERFLVYRLAY